MVTGTDIDLGGYPATKSDSKTSGKAGYGTGTINPIILSIRIAGRILDYKCPDIPVHL
jgi:hypothetical protein